MNIKKIFALVLAAMLLLSLAACAAAPADNGDETTTAANATGDAMYHLIAGGIKVVLGDDGYYYHDLGKDANGNQRVIEAHELTVDLGDYEAEEGWYQITVSYGTFTRIIDVMVLPARNA